ncbi:polyprenyl synthetase family protein [Cochlodiniinecator piscidefendens]|uniref:polyprenyl synthetase family protein n=1 Tax=Cochlodiniinecator piscidefendens TaxID=2715756 RepID=UPI00140D0B07|nr:farnesyl diphosphate synthase [Cochlodiniinecator piscidefendens]
MFKAQLAADGARVQACLTQALGDLADQPVNHAMRYTVKGGKGLRGFLVMESARVFDVPETQSVYAAAAVEALHAYSLVHDDLPCMDDDDLRRGQPTVHVKWDDATAVLAGDALQTLCFELLAREEIGPADRRMALVSSMAQAAGARGMVLGQAQDIAAETADRPLNLDEITELQANKTGALICWSAQAGALIAGADTTHLRHYATALGLAFQIADDIMDVEGDAEKAGKRLQKDEDAGKATFVSLLGLDAAKQRAKALASEAEDALAPYGNKADRLREAARFVIARDS